MKFFPQHRASCSVSLTEPAVHFVLSLFAIFSTFLFLVAPASARLSGEASLTYTSFKSNAPDIAKPDTRVKTSASSLVQNYSLLYSKNGLIYNSRVGDYKVSLGYNWAALDTTFKSSAQPNVSNNFNKSRGHITYNGEINLNPKEIPFKLNIYSHDLSGNNISTSNGTINRHDSEQVIGSIDLPTDINSGLHVESGATLIAGVKNGMTNGYNEILRHFPMILIDYKDTINKDFHSVNHTDDRLSRLAFVSLNKKDNWFHYRHIQYNDYISPSNNYSENEIQLGTVDERMSRRWIDFSNWIKVSTDIQLSKRKSEYQDNAEEEINLNMFVTAERSNWNARTFSTFNRYKDDENTLSYKTTLPVYAAGVLNPDISWDARTSLQDNHDIDAMGKSSKYKDALVGYRVNAFRRALFTLSQSLDAELSTTATSNALTLSGTLETTSSPRFSRKINLGANYTIKNSSTNGENNSSSNFMEQSLKLNGGYTPSNTLRFTAGQSLTLTNGNYTQFDGTTRDSQVQLAQYVNPRGITMTDTGTKTFSSLSNLTVSWNPKPRLTTNLTLSEDIYSDNKVGTSYITDALLGATFTNEAWNLNDTFKYTIRTTDNSTSLSNTATVRYTHSRTLDGSASASYTASYANTGNYYDTTFSQSLNYRYFTRSGMNRKLLEFGETLQYGAGSGTTRNKSLTLVGRYYPISRLTLAAGLGYTYNTSISDYAMVWSTSATANFRLLQASVDYVSNFRKSDGARDNRITGNVRRSF